MRQDLSDDTVELFSDIVEGARCNLDPITAMLGRQCPDIIITHGVFGQSSNWRGIAKALSELCGTNTHLLDMRNHGKSPATSQMSYDSMVADVRRYMNRNGLEKIIFLGHSMGGRVGMQMALENPELVHKLIVVDVAPVTYLSLEEFSAYIGYMKSMDLATIKTRKDADDFLRTFIPGYALRKFLLTNLIPDASGQNAFRWKLNFPGIEKSLSELRAFPIRQENARFTGPSLFIGGRESDYIKAEHIPSMRTYFPNYHLEWIEGAGHWVHADNPKRFLQAVSDFILYGAPALKKPIMPADLNQTAAFLKEDLA